MSMSGRTRIYVILIMTPRLYMLAAMTLNLWILIVIVRQKVHTLIPPDVSRRSRPWPSASSS